MSGVGWVWVLISKTARLECRNMHLGLQGRVADAIFLFMAGFHA